MAHPDYFTTYALYHAADASTRARLLRYYRRWAALFPPACRQLPVLDIGCGWGYLLQALQQEGFDQLKGIDQSAGQVDACRAAASLDVEFTPDSQAWLLEQPPEGWAAITLLDVLEHVPPDRQLPMLEAIWRGLRPGGLLLLRVPNANSSVAMKMRYGDLEHTSAFTEHSLQALLRHAGFASVQISDEPSWGLWPEHAWRRPRAVVSYLYYAALKALFRYWRYLEIKAELGIESARGAPLAPNILGVARKPGRLPEA